MTPLDGQKEAETKQDANEWFDNRQLYEMIQKLNKVIMSLRTELAVTRQIVSQYNNLRGRLDATEAKVNRWESAKSGKDDLKRAILAWGGWIVAIASAAWAVFGS